MFRAVPVSPELLDTLDMVHGIREAQRRGRAAAPLWPRSRMTGFRRVQELIAEQRPWAAAPGDLQGWRLIRTWEALFNTVEASDHNEYTCSLP